ncbi:LuxR C-terminal-related transcriptional regulator [Elizabethkingia meningoseptica]|uniref:LuxR C-terminal-related transcriptional regulator n=1 Tax=Elizabethkingia meningoseptica TaxID=238 RepID=UPI00099AB78D|nr:LuxR C-terminal-related transcriptional regulator [Elizabethkingia meningoseptica]MCL1674242.1 LuxR C-terminal-related transcriptional regulator [Elizabethkingia meningoseptica]MCL1688166.1 LuxR C-terminal-related transcriptional regulator [Elizabethkingia meningoseptica]MDE5491002.1 LuxR C-terminal-related transcriptional regulator [Elizabethkingia meningoseptica]OPB95157.1 helix-turn-helix transcriptional regulator [Elizabethkingia meningoseptica]
MKKKIPPISAEQFLDYYRVNIDDLETNYLEIFSDTIENIKKFAIGPYFWFIGNNVKMKTQWFSQNIDQFTPYSKEEWMNSDGLFFINLFHPEDRYYIIAALEFATKKTLSSIATSKRKSNVNIYGRMIDRQGNYRWILLQSPQVHQNENNQIEASLVTIYDLSHFQIKNMPLLSIIDYEKNEIQYFKHFDQENTKVEVQKPNITNREKEILMLMAQGFNSPGIAEKLFLSYHTVENHKRNLRQKTSTKTSSELIAYAMTHSLLLL